MTFFSPHLLAAASSLFFAFGLCEKAGAHGSLHEQIVAITASLEAKPGDADLLLLRAGLHREHEDWDAAARDIVSAEKAGASAGRLALARTEVAVARKDWDTAARELPTLARELAENADAWRLAGFVHAARRENSEAIAAWLAVTRKADMPRPDDFLSLARAHHAAHDDDAAIAALDTGSRRVGEISVFLEEAAQIEESRGHWDAALARLDRLLGQSPKSPRWLARKGDLAERASQPELATSCRQAALDAIDAIRARRFTPAMAELEQSLRAQLAKSVGEETPTKPSPEK